MTTKKQSALEEAAQHGDIKKVRELQDASSELLKKTYRINTSLMKGELSPETQELSDETLKSIWTTLNEQTNALILAATYGHLEIVNEILKYDAIEKRSDIERIHAECMDVSGYDSKELTSIHTALMYAIQGNHLDIVRALLAHGAANVEHETALTIAERKGHEEIAQVLKAEQAKSNNGKAFFDASKALYKKLEEKCDQIQRKMRNMH